MAAWPVPRAGSRPPRFTPDGTARGRPAGGITAWLPS